MKATFKIGLLAAMTSAGVFLVGAANSTDSLPEGVTAIKVKPQTQDNPFDELVSGWYYRTPETQSLQQDDFDNPGFLWVDKGEELWNEASGAAGKSCATCHDEASVSMKGVGAHMPKWSEALKRPLTLEQQINLCREENMQADAWEWESEDMLSMTAYVKLQSRGMPVDVQDDGPMKEWVEKGKDLYYTRVGQLDMACANCHENYYGKYIRADHLSQGHSNGFPLYRLKWQKLGSLHRRFTGCMRNIRATPYKRGSDEFVALEIYLAHRGKGLQVETPAVRQ